MQWVLYGIMAVAAVLMLWANQQYNSKGAPWGRPVAGLFGVVAVVMAIVAIYYQMTKQGRDRDNIQSREQRYTQISMEFLGRYIGETWPGKEIITVDFATGEMSMGASAERQQLMIDALEQGLAGKARIVGSVKVGEEEMKKAKEAAAAAGPGPGGEPGMDMPMDMMIGQEIFTAKKFDEIVKNNPTDIMVSFIGLPMDYQALKYWKLPKDKRPVLVLTQVPDLTDQNLQKAIATDGMIGAVLTGNPQGNFNYDAPMPEDPKEAFDNRYLLITQDNIRDLIQKHPQLFGAGN